jgi:hypothetical protein
LAEKNESNEVISAKITATVLMQVKVLILIGITLRLSGQESALRRMDKL